MSLRLAFMGTPDFATPTLSELVGQRHDITCVYTQPPRPKGRGLVPEPSPVQRLAERLGLPVRCPASFKRLAEQASFAALGLDGAVVVAYGLILPKPVLVAPKFGCFNLHASLLPRWRGAAPIQRAILAGDSETGVMVMRMEEGLDTGPILMAERTAIDRKTYGELHDELAQTGATLIARALSALERCTLDERPQREAGATYAKKIEKSETRIVWSRTVRELDCLVRGLSPTPGAWFEAQGERIKVLMCEPALGNGAPGTVVGGLTIACGDGALKLLTVQRAGRAPVQAADFLRGFPIASGSRLS